MVFAGLIDIVAAGYFFTSPYRTLLFWAAFVLTRPLGATLGNLLTKPLPDGDLALSRFSSSGIIALFIVVCILMFSRQAGAHPAGQSA